MTLYHFCAAHLKDAILAEGLTLGGYPLISKGEIIPNIQWLTAEADPRKQSWATKNLISYSRTAFRLTVNIPESHRKKLHRAVQYAQRFPEQDREIITAAEYVQL